MLIIRLLLDWIILGSWPKGRAGYRVIGIQVLVMDVVLTGNEEWIGPLTSSVCPGPVIEPDRQPRYKTEDDCQIVS
ncbi:uncharacterized protein BO66DRAFT_174315 [Aspergillus aculeatinus CBS 121060]|uniref:Uncharacterized protein n=1 Tax=Aspergillus aculeatinus CBS 121060 TaxID=1448322 RepID=A0ACD1HJP6_9EURO|nr:hypothetical protein BO66DRAFT_174315 [Aspergillus aculeatinus CBS 121060]RAH73820.1 hypothetical protein BO66DRAFT_174315 [Aspergillus aculeatinus CBS 121060]